MTDVVSRSPHGERGLKYACPGFCVEKVRSLPPRGAWIEIGDPIRCAHRVAVAPPTGSVD